MNASALRFFLYVCLFCIVWFLSSILLYIALVPKTRPDTSTLLNGIKPFKSSEDDGAVMHTLMILSSTVSITSDIFVCITYWWQRRTSGTWAKNNLQIKLLSFIALLDIARCIAFLLSILQSNWIICHIQAFVIQFGSLATVLWNNVYCCFIYAEFQLFKASANSIRKNEWMFHLFVCAFSIGTAIVPLMMHIYGQNFALWCWIRDPLIGFMLLYIPIILVFIFNCLAQITAFVAQRYRKRRASQLSNHILNGDDNLLFIQEVRSEDLLSSIVAWQMRLQLLIFAMTWSAGTIYRLMELLDLYVTDNDTIWKVSTWFKYVHTSIAPLNGFFYCFAYLIITKGRAFSWLFVLLSKICKTKGTRPITPDTDTDTEEKLSLNSNANVDPVHSQWKQSNEAHYGTI
jgi:hypothetical protein